MVLESLSNPYKAEMHPGWVMLHGAIYSVISILLGMWLWPQYASLVAVFLITGASIPLLYNLIKYEEEKDYHELEEKLLLKEHSKAVRAYFYLFVGITLAMAAMFLILPASQLSTAFGVQMETYQAINPAGQIVGAATEVTGNATSMAFFSRIFLNNIRVLVFCVLFSFLYGAGAIFILTWNASVIALAIGNTIRSEVAQIATTNGLVKAGAYLNISFQTIVLRYGLHGTLEILAYIIAGLAGGIISVAVIRHHYSERKFEHIIMDSADLLLIAMAILFLAGAWEAFITPIFYL